METALSARLQKMFKVVSWAGKSYAIAQVQSMLMPHILKIFSEHDHSELENFIITGYPLVENHTPDAVKNALHNLGSNPEMRSQWESLVLELLTPETIISWLRNPEDWLADEDADRQREELKHCAEVLEETPGGEAWLEEQVSDLYRYANIIPEDSKPIRPNK